MSIFKNINLALIGRILVLVGIGLTISKFSTWELATGRSYFYCPALF